MKKAAVIIFFAVLIGIFLEHHSEAQLSNRNPTTGAERVEILNSAGTETGTTTNPFLVRQSFGTTGSVTFQNAATANGNGTTQTVTGYQSGIITVESSVAMSGGTTVNFESIVVSSGTYRPLHCLNLATGVLETSTTVDGIWRCNIADMLTWRARISNYSAGTVTAQGFISVVGVPSHSWASQSGTWTVQPGNTANTTPWLVEGAVSCSNCTGSGASDVDDSSFTLGTDSVAPAGFLADESGTDPVDEGDVGLARMTLDRKMLTRIVGATDANRWDVDGSGHGQIDIAAFSAALPAGTNNIGDVDVLTLPALPAGTNNIGDVDVLTLPALPAGTNNIGDVDVLSVIPGTGATNLGKATGGAAGATDTGVAPLAIRDDSLTTLSDPEGDYVQLRVNSTGALHVTGAGGGTQFAEDAALGSTPTGTLAMCRRNDALSTLTPVEDDAVGCQVDSRGALWVAWSNPLTPTIDGVYVIGNTDHDVSASGIDPVLTGGFASAAAPTSVSADGDAVNAWFLRNGAQATVLTAAGALIGGDATNGLDVDVTRMAALVAGNANIGDVDIASIAAGNNNIGDVDVASVIPGTGATNSGKAVGAVAGATDTGFAPLAIRDDALSTLSDPEGDYVQLRVSSTGALHVTGGGGGTQYNIDDVASATATGTFALVVRKDSGASLAGTDGDVTGLQVDANGALRVTGGGGGTEYAVNAAAPADPTGATFVMERDDAITALTEVEGDWTNPRSTAEGALWTQDFNSDTMVTHLATVAGAVSGTEMQVDVLTLPNVTIGAAIPAGTNNIGDVDIASIAAGDNNIGNVDIVSSALPTGASTSANQSTIITALQLIDDDQTGASVNYKTSAGTTEDETEIKATAGRLFSITATNTNAAARYLRCANLTAANTTPGTSTVFLGLAIPGNTAGSGFTTNFGPAGIAFSTALTCWTVTGAADSDVAEVAANEVKWIISYK